MKNLDSYFKNKKKSNYNINDTNNIKKNIGFNYKDLSNKNFKEDHLLENNIISKKIITSTQFKNIDYSDFSNHVFFDSAIHKVSYSFENLIKYPYDKKESEVYSYFNDLDGYTNYILKNVYPKYIGSIKFSGNEKIVIRDKKGFLLNDYKDDLTKIHEGYLSPEKENYSFRFWVKLPDIVDVDYQIIFKKIIVNQNKECQEGYFCFIKKENNSSWSINYSIVYNDLSSINYKTIIDENIGNSPFHCTVNVSTNSLKNVSISFLINGNNVLSMLDSSNLKLQYQKYTNEFKKKEIDFIVGNSESFLFENVQYNNFSGSLDELIFLNINSKSKTVKLEKDDNIFTNENVLLYLKFNEPPGEYINRNLIIDSSGNKHHGILLDNNDNVIENSSNIKVQESFLNKENELYSPVVIGNYPEIINERNSLINKAKEYDINNANIIFKLIPKHYFIASGIKENKSDYVSESLSIVEESDDFISSIGKNNNNNNLTNICLIWARFFDQLKLHVDAISHLHKCDYDDLNDEKYINAHIELLCKKYGFDFVPIFENITKQKIKGNNLQNDDVTLEYDFIKVQNMIWKKILLNSQDIIRSKGTKHSLNSLINSIGFDIKNYININEKSYVNYVDLTRDSYNKEEFYIYNFNFGYPNNFLDVTEYDQLGFPVNKPYINIENIKYNENDNLYNGLPKKWAIDLIFNFNDQINKDEELSRVLNKGDNYLKYNLTQSLFRLDVDNNCYLNLYLNFRNKDALFCDLVLDIDPFIHNPNYRSFIYIEDVNIFDISNYVCINFSYDKEKEDLYDVLDIELFYNKYNVKDTGSFEKSAKKSIKIKKGIYEDNLISFFNKNVSFRTGEFNYDTESLPPNRINNVFENLTPTVFQGEISTFGIWKENLTSVELSDHSNDMLSISTWPEPGKIINNKKCLLKVLNRKNIESVDGNFNLLNSNFIQNYTDISDNSVVFANQRNTRFDQNFTKRKYFRSFKDIILNNNVGNNLVFINSFSNQNNKKLYNNFKENPTNDYNEVLDKTEINLFSMEFSSSNFYDRQLNRLILSLDDFNNTFLSIKNRTDADYYRLSKLREEYFSNFSETELFNFDELFNIFKYFDNILNEIITELVPNKMTFKGFNYVYQSHSLERFNYGYRDKKRFIENQEPQSLLYKVNNRTKRNKY